ncbi:MAG: galactose-1-phosphate uridylyltransferase, partial [Treponemataceae bacterium]|nr:galactose-1-phosphate uridylyltransferase [Treponemataceae bacterium]
SKDETLSKHADWANEILRKHKVITQKNVNSILQKEIGIVFSKVLEHAGVFKCTEEGKAAFLRFVEKVNC